MKIGICAIIKDENDYLDEWIDYHLKLVDHIYLYDNLSKEPVLERERVSVKLWPDNEIGSQMRAYKDLKTDCDYIAYIDIDEFIVCNNLKSLIESLKEKYEFEGLAISWRMYGSNPYFTERKCQTDYVKYFPDKHIKSIINPNKIKYFPDPHFAIIEGNYINENGKKVTGPFSNHTSTKIYIKHIYTRSLPEWEEKIKRGSGDKVKRNKNIKEFILYNKSCIYT